MQRGKKKRDKQWYTTYYKNIHSGVNSYAPVLLVVPVLLVKPAVLLLKDTNIIWYGSQIGHRYA
jgi:hypothetical protein